MPSIVLRDATLIDGTGADPRPHVDVLVEDGRIARVGDVGSVADTDTIDAAGRTLMPGLTDAHVHFGIVEAGANAAPESHVARVIKTVENIGIALDEGFTTVRDAGFLDPAFASTVESGLIRGPRILPAGSPLSITGGHGDQRHRYGHDALEPIPGLVAHAEIVDGAEAVRLAARRQIRLGATQIKLMASGGVMSPSDPIDSLQFTVDEMSAAVGEAEAFGLYAMAHCHTSGAINRALDAGVRSIEHGSILDEATARRMAEHHAYLVPTLVIIEILARAGAVPEFSKRKLETVRAEMRASLERAVAAGVAVGSGSDLLGPKQRRRSSELVEKAKHMGAMGAIVSATGTNARLFRMEHRIGTIAPGMDADLILVDGDSVSDIGVLVDATNISLVMKGGSTLKTIV
jgi:imidazolonepropionase-like amidohydrolase